ncbi:MAG: PQQ-binding-like beta-propeller repeat protein, partial [Candidatus Thermoplasmatota archaeon]
MIREAWSRTARDAVYGIAISKNGEYIVTGSWDKTIACYDRLGKILWSYKSGGQVWGTDICDDGSYVIGGSTDKNVYCFKWKEKIFARYRVGSPIWSVAISSDGRYIVAGAEDGNVYFFERGSGKLFWSAATKNAVYGVGISSDGRYVVAGSGDTNVYCYGFGKELWKYTTNGLVWGIGISRIGNYVVAGSEDGWIYCFDIKGRILWRHFLEERPWGVRISDRGEFVVVGSERGYIYCLKGKNGQLLWKFDTKSPSNPVYSVAVSGNGEYIVACSKKESIFFFENLGPASKHAIERVKSLIRVGSGTDFDLSDAKKIIEKAEEAFARNDYALALDLAKNAENYTKEIPKYHVLDRKLVQNWLFSLGVVEKAAEASPDLIRIVGPLYIKTEEISSDRTVGEKIVGYEEKVETFKNILKNYEKIALKER